MSPSHITESTVENAALDWLAGLGWRIAHGSNTPCRLASSKYPLNCTQHINIHPTNE